MIISDVGLDLIKRFEGCRLTAYRDAVGVLTIGYGHTKGVVSGQKITQAQADQYLREDCQKAEQNVRSYDATYHWTQNEFDALVSFTFNIGSINELTKKGTRSKAEIAWKMPQYCKAGGKMLAGLYARRIAEKELFESKAQAEPKGQLTYKPVEMPMIRRGCKGDPVKLWQILIGVTADGIFGAQTEQATIERQKKLFPQARGEWDGVVGTKTWRAEIG